MTPIISVSYLRSVRFTRLLKECSWALDETSPLLFSCCSDFKTALTLNNFREHMFVCLLFNLTEIVKINLN